MIAITPPLEERLTLEGWLPEQLGPVLHQTNIDYLMQSVESESWEGIEFLDSRESDGAHAQYQVVARENPPPYTGGSIIWTFGPATVLIMVECWQTGSRLNVKLYCYFELARPLFKEILSELGVEQQKTEKVTLENSRLQIKPQGRQPDPNYDKAFRMIVTGGGTEEAQKEAFVWYCNVSGVSNPGKNDREAFKKAMNRRDKKT